MSRLAVCDRCGMEMGDSFAVPITRLTTHLNSSARFFYEGDLCNDCIDEVVSFIKVKPDSYSPVNEAPTQILTMLYEQYTGADPVVDQVIRLIEATLSDEEVRHATHTAASTLEDR